MREYKYVCKDCKEHLTNSEDRLCEWCRDKKRVNSAQICIICGKKTYSCTGWCVLQLSSKGA